MPQRPRMLLRLGLASVPLLWSLGGTEQCPLLILLHSLFHRTIEPSGSPGFWPYCMASGLGGASCTDLPVILPFFACSSRPSTYVLLNFIHGRGKITWPSSGDTHDPADHDLARSRAAGHRLVQAVKASHG
jgi:hypothetical protein